MGTDHGKNKVRIPLRKPKIIDAKTRKYCQALLKVYGKDKFRYHILKLIVDNTKKETDDTEKTTSQRHTSRC